MNRDPTGDPLRRAGDDADVRFGEKPVGQAVQPCPPGKQKVSIRFIKPAQPRENFQPTGLEPEATQLEFGFWDNAAALAGPKATAPTTLNGQEQESQNLVGGDSRRFHIVVEDACARGKGFVEVDWWTANQNSDARQSGVVYDDPQSKLALLETQRGSGLFVSKGLMLVDDLVDRSIEINSGFSKTDPVPAYRRGLCTDEDSDYRIRRSGMFGYGVASYTSKAQSATATTVVPVFKPSERLLLPVQIYVLRKQKGGDPCVPLSDLAANDLRVLTETYERYGIWTWSAVSQADLSVPGVQQEEVGSPIKYTLLIIDPPSAVRTASVNLDGMDAVAKTFPAMPNVVRLFFVEKILVRVNGEYPLGFSFGDNYAAPASTEGQTTDFPRPTPATTLGTSFVRPGAGDPYTAAHELGHLLIKKPANGGHYKQPSDISRPGARHVARLDLMFPRPTSAGENAFGPKRIWDLSDGDGYDQYNSLCASRFLRG